LKPAIVMAVAVLAVACKDNSGPQDPWVGTWDMVSVDSLSLPANYTIGGDSARAVFRTLTLYSSGQGMWQDSSLVANGSCGRKASPNALCNTSGEAVVTWKASFDTLTVKSVFGETIGTVAPVKVFVKQADGSLLKTDDNQYEVYRR